MSAHPVFCGHCDYRIHGNPPGHAVINGRRRAVCGACVDEPSPAAQLAVELVKREQQAQDILLFRPDWAEETALRHARSNAAAGRDWACCCGACDSWRRWLAGLKAAHAPKPRIPHAPLQALGTAVRRQVKRFSKLLRYRVTTYTGAAIMLVSALSPVDAIHQAKLGPCVTVMEMKAAPTEYDRLGADIDRWLVQARAEVRKGGAA